MATNSRVTQPHKPKRLKPLAAVKSSASGVRGKSGLVQNVRNVRIVGRDSLTRLAATAVRDSFSETVNRVAYQGERIALERHGKTVAALVTVEDLELLQAFEDRIDLAAARRALKERGRLDWTKVKAGLGL